MKLSTYIQQHTAKAVAEKCAVSVSTITRIAKHKQHPRPHLIAKIIEATDGKVQLEDIVGIRAVAQAQIPQGV